MTETHEVKGCDSCPLFSEGCYCGHPASDWSCVWDEPDMQELNAPPCPARCPLRKAELLIWMAP